MALHRLPVVLSIKAPHDDLPNIDTNLGEVEYTPTSPVEWAQARMAGTAPDATLKFSNDVANMLEAEARRLRNKSVPIDLGETDLHVVISIESPAGRVYTRGKVGEVPLLVPDDAELAKYAASGLIPLTSVREAEHIVKVLSAHVTEIERRNSVVVAQHAALLEENS